MCPLAHCPATHPELRAEHPAADFAEAKTSERNRRLKARPDFSALYIAKVNIFKQPLA
jgi:hypothetical protein